MASTRSNTQCDSENWLLRYCFWRGQYSVRNADCIRRYELYLRIMKKLKYNCSNDECFDFIIGSVLFGVVDKSENKFINLEIPDNLQSVVDIEELIQANILKSDLDSHYPYMHDIKINPLYILKSIHNDQVPNIELFYKGRTQLRSKSVSKVFDHQEKSKMIVEVDLNANFETIISELRRLYEIEKSNYDEEIRIELDFPELKYSLPKMKEELTSNGSAYRVGGDESRAVGLLLFDHIAENGGTDADAIRWAKSELAERGPKTFGKAKSGDRQFQRWLANTRKCIEAAEVLEI